MAALEKYQPRCRIFLLDGEKFRTNLLVLFFDLPLKRETATKTALLAEMLKRVKWKESVVQAEELYGALWDVSVVKKGDRQLLLFSIEVLKTVDIEDVLAFLHKLIYCEPFSEKNVERQKEILKRKLQARQDDKRAFARKRVSEETAEGTAYGISADGYVEDLDEINDKMLWAWYRQVLEEAEVKVFFCGDKVERPKILLFRQWFSGRVPVSERKVQEHSKNGPRFLQEKAEIEQARFGMGFYGDVGNSRRQAAFLLLNQLLGGDPDSLLFQKIREEQGLCYDVKSYLEPMSPYLFIQAGIKEENAKEIGKLVLKCIEQIKKGGISSEKLQQAKETMIRNYDGLADSLWAMVDFFAECALQGKPLTTEKFFLQIERTEVEDIVRVANHLELKTVYLLGKEAESNGVE